MKGPYLATFRAMALVSKHVLEKPSDSPTAYLLL